MVEILDFRGLDLDINTFSFTDDALLRRLRGATANAIGLFPCARVIHTTSDTSLHLQIAFMSKLRPPQTHYPLQVLSLRGLKARIETPTVDALRNCLKELVYLDLSFTWGLFDQLVQPNVDGVSLWNHLRVLKLQRASISDISKLWHYCQTVWSLDIRENGLSDHWLQALISSPTISRAWLESSRLTTAADIRTQHPVNQHAVVDRTGSNLPCPEQYWMPSPRYGVGQLYGDAVDETFDPIFEESDEQTVCIESTHRLRRQDDVQFVIEELRRQEVDCNDIRRRPCHGITHLHLSGNKVSSDAVADYIARANGRIESLTCGLEAMPRKNIQGFMDPSFFRIAVSPRLWRLEIHHSIVTHVPRIDNFALSTATQRRLAEDFASVRAHNLYPERFAPDMNPRLYELTLVDLPLESTGLIVDIIIDFLKLLAKQERDIAKARRRYPCHTVKLETGIRRLILSFDQSTEIGVDPGWLESSVSDNERGTPTSAQDLAGLRELPQHIGISNVSHATVAGGAEHKEPQYTSSHEPDHWQHMMQTNWWLNDDGSYATSLASSPRCLRIWREQRRVSVIDAIKVFRQRSKGTHEWFSGSLMLKYASGM